MLEMLALEEDKIYNNDNEDMKEGLMIMIDIYQQRIQHPKRVFFNMIIIDHIDIIDIKMLKLRRLRLFQSLIHRLYEIAYKVQSQYVCFTLWLHFASWSTAHSIKLIFVGLSAIFMSK
jgi:uncharacterized membrane protein